jgi:hypothetical protein
LQAFKLLSKLFVILDYSFKSVLLWGCSQRLKVRITPYTINNPN